MSSYDKYFTVISIWLVTLAVMVRMQIGVAFILLTSIGIIALIICAVKNIKLIKPIKKQNKV